MSSDQQTSYSQKVVIIGLDGATLNLVQPWMDAGHLPTLQKLASGACGVLNTIVPPITPAAWTSAVTGTNPGKHGIYDFYRHEEDSYQFTPVNSSYRKSTPLWDILDAHGKKSCFINVPMTYPAQPLNGTMITGLLTPRGEDMKDVTYTHPETLHQELLEKVPDYEVFPSVGYRKGHYEEFWSGLKKVTDARFEAIRHLNSKDQPDFLMFVLNGTDLCEHFFWHVIDPTHPRHDPEEAKELGDPILRFFQYVDEHLTRLLKELAQGPQGEKTTFLVMSDHGQGPLHQWFYTNNWLHREGLLKFRSNPTTLAKRAMYKAGMSPATAFKLLSKFGGSKAKVDFAKRQQLLRKYFLSLGNVNWKKTVAYSFGNVGQLRINVKGREPFGSVRPEDYDSVCQDLKARLSELKTPEGELFAENIWLRDELYQGEHLDLGPDIVFFPRDLSTQALGSGDFVSHRIFEPSFGNSGDHRMEGLIMLQGCNVGSQVAVEQASILDIAPTCLYLLGLPVSKDMDGQILTQALDHAFVQNHPPTYADAITSQKEETAISDAEAEIVRQRLRDLGYVA